MIRRPMNKALKQSPTQPFSMQPHKAHSRKNTNRLHNQALANSVLQCMSMVAYRQLHDKGLVCLDWHAVQDLNGRLLQNILSAKPSHLQSLQRQSEQLSL